MQNCETENPKSISRRDFLRLGGLTLGALALRPWRNFPYLVDFPEAKKLGRATATINLRARPDLDANLIGKVYEDTVFPWIREVIGPMPYQPNQRWVETPDGYIWAPSVQPVANTPNPNPPETLPDSSMGPGFWAEVTVPYVDLSLANPPARSEWAKEATNPRLYYSQVLWIDAIERNSNDELIYRVTEPYGSYGDVFWAAAEAFTPLTPEDIAPIHPDVEDKRVVVDVTHQTLACYEGNTEVYFCQISSGAKFDAYGDPVEEWATPPGSHPTWRKLVSIHMAGGTTGGGWDLPGIPWTALFVGTGVAIHSTHWHNNWGVPMSHGCVNARPEDAKWVWRWMNPIVSYDPGDISVTMASPGTYVNVIEA
ncbi:MAG: L,D-transpeptidase [Anaerolineales bacterium]|nr:L,D-transpeptidase [Anaerolineales bacterium]